MSAALKVVQAPFVTAHAAKLPSPFEMSGLAHRLYVASLQLRAVPRYPDCKDILDSYEHAYAEAIREIKAVLE